MLTTLGMTIALIVGTPASWTCYSQTGYEYCPECPGFTYCLCIETVGGWVCPSRDVWCNSRPTLSVGLFWFVKVDTYCYQERACYPPPGGCGPENPCIKDDAIGHVGTMSKYVAAGFPCI